MFTHGPGKRTGGILLVRRLADRRYRQGTKVRQDSEVTILHDESTDELLEIKPILFDPGERTNIQQPQILLAFQFGEGIIGKPWSDDHFDKRGRNFLGRGQIHDTVKCQHASERRDRIGLASLHIGLHRCGSQRHAAGVVVLNDGDSGVGILLHQLQGRVGVQEVVIGHRFAMQDLPS